MAGMLRAKGVKIIAATLGWVWIFQSFFFHFLLSVFLWFPYISFVTITFYFTDKYSALVSGEASEHVKQFISRECSFDDYTQVIITLCSQLTVSVVKL